MDVYVVEDDNELRSALSVLLEDYGLNVRPCASAVEFLNIYNPRTRACLLLDLHLPEISGLELQRILKEKCINIPTVILTGHGDVPLAVQCIKAGAREFIEKPFNEQILLDTIAQLTTEATPEFSNDHKLGLLSSLTNREYEITNLVCEGQKNKQIAAALGISVRTVENHRASIMKKLQVRTASQLTLFFMKANNK